MFKNISNIITGAVLGGVHDAAALAHRIDRAISPVNYDNFGLDVLALSKAVTKKENFNLIKDLMEQVVDIYNSQPGAEKCSLVDVLTYDSKGKTDPKSQRKQEAVSTIRFAMYAHLIDMMRTADEHLNEKTLPGVLAEIVLRSFDLDNKNHSARLDGALEPEVVGLLKAVATMVFEMEADKTINPQSWQNLLSVELADSNLPSPPPQSPKTPVSEKSNESDTKLKNALVEYLSNFFQELASFTKEAARKAIQKISAKDDGALFVPIEQRYSPELLAVSEFDSQNFAKEHVRDLPKIVDFLTHVFEKPADEKDQEFRKSLFIFIKAKTLGKVAPEGAMGWIDPLLGYLKQESLTDRPEANKAIESRNIAREHIIDIVIHQVFPSLKNSPKSEDFKLFRAEFKDLLQHTNGAGDIINHLSPKAFEILRKPEHQAYLRTLVDTVITGLYSYTPEQLQIDHRRNLEVAPIEERVESLKIVTPPGSLRSRSTSDTASMTSIGLSTSSGVTSTTSTKRDWSVHEKYGEHFTDDMMHFLLNSKSLTATNLSDLLKDIGSVKIDGIFRRLFAHESSNEQPHLNNESQTQKLRYNEEVFDGLVMQNPAGLLRFVAKILVQALPDPDNEKITSLTEKFEKTKRDEEVLATDLWNAFKSPIDSLESHMRLLTQGLADYGAGIDSKDKNRVAQGLDKILTLLPTLNENLLQSDPPNNIVKMIVRNILPIPSNIEPDQVEAFTRLQLRLFREVANNLTNTVKNGTYQEAAQARAHWAAALSYFITPVESKDYGLQAQAQTLSSFEKFSSCWAQVGSTFSVLGGTLTNVTSIVRQSYDNLIKNNQPEGQEQRAEEIALLAKYYPTIYYGVATAGTVVAVNDKVLSAVKTGASFVTTLFSGWGQSYKETEPQLSVFQESAQKKNGEVRIDLPKSAKGFEASALASHQSTSSKRNEICMR